MGSALTIRDETSKGEVLTEYSLQFSVQMITVEELITARVLQETDAYNAKTNGEFKGLVQPSTQRGRAKITIGREGF